jgi:hypothetical protein
MPNIFPRCGPQEKLSVLWVTRRKSTNELKLDHFPAFVPTTQKMALLATTTMFFYVIGKNAEKCLGLWVTTRNNYDNTD